MKTNITLNVLVVQVFPIASYEMYKCHVLTNQRVTDLRLVQPRYKNARSNMFR